MRTWEFMRDIHIYICIYVYIYICVYIYMYITIWERNTEWLCLVTHWEKCIMHMHDGTKKNLIMNWMRNWIWTQRPTNEDKNWMCIWIRTQRPTNKDNKIKFELPIKPSLYAKVIQFEEFRWEELPAGKQISFSIQITHNMIGLIIIFLYDAKQNSVSIHKWL